jgi:hypothetical protein
MTTLYISTTVIPSNRIVKIITLDKFERIEEEESWPIFVLPQHSNGGEENLEHPELSPTPSAA